jgi:hypothetical protein
VQLETQIKILEAGIMDVCPEAKVVFGYNNKFLWEKEKILALDKKGVPKAHTDIAAWVEKSELNEAEAGNLAEQLSARLQDALTDFKNKANTAEAILTGMKMRKDKDW